MAPQNLVSVTTLDIIMRYFRMSARGEEVQAQTHTRWCAPSPSPLHISRANSGLPCSSHALNIIPYTRSMGKRTWRPSHTQGVVTILPPPPLTPFLPLPPHPPLFSKHPPKAQRTCTPSSEFLLVLFPILSSSIGSWTGKKNLFDQWITSQLARGCGPVGGDSHKEDDVLAEHPVVSVS